MRMTRNDYAESGSFDRVLEAAIALADADSDDDQAFDRAKARMRSALAGYTRSVVQRLTSWQRKGGKARWANVPKAERIEHARRMHAARVAKEASKQAHPVG
jgi:hypothetical protein